MKLLKRMKKSNNRKNSGFTLVELVIVMAIMGILGLAVAGFIGTSTKQYKYASKDVDLQYEAQLTMNQIGDLIIDAQKGVKYEPATVAAPVEVASAEPKDGYVATASAEETSSEEASAEETSSDSKLIIYNNDCTYYIIYRQSEHKIYLRKDTLDPATGAVKADGQVKESLMAENVTGFTPDLSEAEKKNSVGLVMDFKAGDKKYTSKQNFTMRNKVPVGKDVEYVEEPKPEELKGIRIYYRGKDVTNGTVNYEWKENNNKLRFIDKIIGEGYDASDVTWSNNTVGDVGVFNSDGSNYNIVVKSETLTQFVITVKTNKSPVLEAKVTVNITHPWRILYCGEDKHFSFGSTHTLSINEGQLSQSPLGGKYKKEDFIWHIEMEKLGSNGTTEFMGEVEFKLGENGKGIYDESGNGDPNGYFQYSSAEVVGNTGTSDIDKIIYYDKLNYYINTSCYAKLSLGNKLENEGKLNISVWLSLKDEPNFRSNTVTFYTHHDYDQYDN